MIEGVWNKYKWHIIVYIIYVCFISTIVSDEWNWGKSEYWRLWVIWCIMIPLIAYCGYSYLKYRRDKNKS